MKTIRYKRGIDQTNRIKKIAINQQSEDKESRTNVRKSFIYKVTQSTEQNPQPEAPEIFIKKIFDSKKMIEKFSFRVKGQFYMKHEDKLIQVNFHHSLNIVINWKSKDFSPKKSAVLTEE